jgi:hypothetical protein
MSLHADGAANAHLTISAPGCAGLGTGAYTVAVLYKTIVFVSATMIWRAYQADNFSRRGLYVDGDMWVVNEQADTNIPTFSDPTKWHWLVVSKGSSNEPPRAHWALYQESGPMAWSHVDALSSQSNQSPINRVCLADEFGDSFRGHIACLAAFETELSDVEIETYFEASSSAIMSAFPGFFVHWPLAEGLGSPFVDIAGGGVESIRSGSWDMTADPPGFDFSLGRSGRPKVWSGSVWDRHQAKSWSGSMWVPSEMSGATAEGWIASK